MSNYVFWQMAGQPSSWWKWTPGGYVRVQRGPALWATYRIGNDDDGYRGVIR